MKLDGLLVLTSIGDNIIYLSNKNKLVSYNILTNKIINLYDFKIDFLTKISNYSKLFRRLFRTDIRYGIQLDSNNLLVVRNKKIHRFNLTTLEIESSVVLPLGSRPLNMTTVRSLEGFDDGVYFGEYFENPKKTKVRIFLYSNDTLTVVYEFENGIINHIHNIIVDYYSNCLWILTGDFGDSPGIYQATNNFNTVKCIVGGNQIYRSCVAFPTKEGLIYATDSQFEKNTIRLLYRSNNIWKTKSLYDINGPCIYGTSVGNNFYLSTSVEAINSGNLIRRHLRNIRGPGVIKNRSEIISGNIHLGFKTIYINDKDIFPFLLFQFGNIIFPSGENNLTKLVFSNIALKNDDLSTIIMDLKKI